MQRLVVVIAFVMAGMAMLVPGPVEAGTTCTTKTSGSCCGKYSAACTECKTTTLSGGTWCTSCYGYKSTEVSNQTNYGENTFGQTPQTRFILEGTLPCPDDPTKLCIDIRARCWPKQCESRPDQPQCTNVFQSSGQPFLFPGPIEETTEDVDCAKKKNCHVFKTSAVLIGESDFDDSVCAPGHVLQSVFAEEFVGTTLSCAGGFDSAGTCCATSERLTGGTCAVTGTPLIVKVLCTKGSQLALGQGYECVVEPEVEQ